MDVLLSILEFILGVELTDGAVTWLVIIFFCGLCFGWLCKKGNIILMVIGLSIFLPIIVVIMQADIRFLTIPFVCGFLIHTAKPIYKKVWMND